MDTMTYTADQSPSQTAAAIRDATVAELLSLAHQAEQLAATLPDLDIPPKELAEALAQVRRLGMRLGAIEEALSVLGPGLEQRSSLFESGPSPMTYARYTPSTQTAMRCIRYTPSTRGLCWYCNDRNTSPGDSPVPAQISYGAQPHS